MKHKIKKTGKYTLKSTNILLNVTVLILLPLVVFTLISSKTNKIAGIQSFVVLTGSMEPKLPVGSVIFTIPYEVYNRGDVIAFNKDGKTITHRVTNRDIDKTGFVYNTKGDANNVTDQGAVLGASVVGKQVVVVPYLGKFINFLTTVQGFVLFILAPIAVFILFELWNIKKEMERSIEAKYARKMQVQEAL